MRAEGRRIRIPSHIRSHSTPTCSGSPLCLLLRSSQTPMMASHVLYLRRAVAEGPRRRRNGTCWLSASWSLDLVEPWHILNGLRPLHQPSVNVFRQEPPTSATAELVAPQATSPSFPKNGGVAAQCSRSRPLHVQPRSADISVRHHDRLRRVRHTGHALHRAPRALGGLPACLGQIPLSRPLVDQSCQNRGGRPAARQSRSLSRR